MYYGMCRIYFSAQDHKCLLEIHRYLERNPGLGERFIVGSSILSINVNRTLT